MSDHEELHLLSGAFALDALDDEEKNRFEAYLLTSEESRTEVASLSETAVAIANATPPVAPPAALKARLMAQIAQTPQLAPLVVVRPVLAAAPPLKVAPEPTPISDASTNLIDIAARSTSTSAGATPATRKASARWFVRPASILIGAAAAVALFVGGTVVGNSNVPQPVQNQQASSITSLMATGDSQVAKAEVSGGGTATFVWSAHLGQSAVLIDKLPALASGQTYELWYIDGKSIATPAGTFQASDSGHTVRILDGKMRAGDTIGITIEPSGGSEKPTTAPIVAVPSA